MERPACCGFFFFFFFSFFLLLLKDFCGWVILIVILVYVRSLILRFGGKEGWKLYVYMYVTYACYPYLLYENDQKDIGREIGSHTSLVEYGDL